MKLSQTTSINRTFFLAPLLCISITACSGGGSASTNSDEDTPPPSKALSLSNFQNAATVIGQADFTGTSANQGGSPDANTIDGPFASPGSNNGILYLPEYNNNRMLAYNNVPTTNNQVADFVLGQPNFTTVAAGTSDTAFDGPLGITAVNGKMYMPSYNDHRVLIWNNVPISGGVAADITLGQLDLVSRIANCTKTSLNNPAAISVTGNKVVVVDSGNNRVLIWNTIPTENGTPADIILGQQSFTNCARNDSDDDGIADNATASTLNNPFGVWTDGTRLVVLDTDNNRTLIWNNFPTGNFTPADIVLGQNDFLNTAENDDDQDGITDGDGSIASARTLNGPLNGVYSNGEQLFITDSENNRILVWNTFPTDNFTPADTVLGQSDFANITINDDDQDNVEDTNASARTLSYPSGIYQLNKQLIVADGDNNRYLIYNDNGQ
ncbi:hypothetical protein MNBD_GAMMA06-294 [hydrothermal vent metagenome]|uniref:NHL repeat containing protein n=1 Tax=hydrothermal vent metagenome TaxID=652676 RepID=A0A3B0WGC2_9ZZZZ